MKIERKLIDLGSIECKDIGETEAMRFSGYGAMFNNVDAHGDVIDPGAFKKSLSKAKGGHEWPVMLLQHGGWQMSPDDMMPVGVWDSIAEDENGLVVEGVLAPTQRGKDVYALMKMKPRPAITGLSIGYIPKKFTMGTKPEEPRRKLHEVELIEISPVTFPANTRARVSSVKSIEDLSEREFEAFLRDAGFSRKDAMTVISRGFRSLLDVRRDAVTDAGLKSIADSIQRNINLFQGTQNV